MPSDFRIRISKLWIYTLIITVFLFLMALEIAIFGNFPGIDDPGAILYICWSILGLSSLLLHVSFISGYAHDIEKHNKL